MIVLKGVIVEGEAAGDVVPLGLLRPASLTRHLSGVVERSQHDAILESLFFERQNIMS
jgi:hypothetical protein